MVYSWTRNVATQYYWRILGVFLATFLVANITCPTVFGGCLTTKKKLLKLVWLKGGDSHFFRTFSDFYHVGLLTVSVYQAHRHTGSTQFTVFNFYKAGKIFLGADSHFFRTFSSPPPFQPHHYLVSFYFFWGEII